MKKRVLIPVGLSAAVLVLLLILKGLVIFGFLYTVVALIFEGNVEGIKAYLAGFGIWTPFLLASLIIFQSVIAPIPEIPLSMASGLLYGTLRGFLLVWFAVIAGAWINFGLARILGRPLVARFFKKRHLERFDELMAEYGELAILVGRLLPFIPFDFMSYAAGLTLIRWWRFLFYTALGAFPSTLAFVIMGQQLADFNLFTLLFSLGILALTFGFGWWYLQHRRNRQQAAGNSQQPKSPFKKGGGPP